MSDVDESSGVASDATPDSVKPPAIFLLGPTAAGKTELAITLATQWPMEIISVDSALVYRGMDIGTAKPTWSERNGIPHHLIDVRDPADPYSVAAFVEDATFLMADVTRRGCVPLLVGGTMLYAKALLGGLAVLPKADAVVRARIAALAESAGWPHVHQLLQEVDPATAARLHPNDAQRLQRALEVCWTTGQPFSDLLLKGATHPAAAGSAHLGRLTMQAYKNFDYEPLILGLMPQDRLGLHEKIAKRFKVMLDSGFLREVQQLYDRGDLHETLPAIRCVGYRQAWGHLRGDYDYDTFVDRAVAATRQLAKRQLTWLRSWPGLTVVASDVTLTARAVHQAVAGFLR
ncbi:MAG: tRNA (adenosine(37)-N6)-dimethylallyltransferase MiaA [Gammaproteobacteria bacterium]